MCSTRAPGAPPPSSPSRRTHSYRRHSRYVTGCVLPVCIVNHQVLSDQRILSAPVLQDGLEFIGFIDTHDLLRGLIKHVYPELLEQVLCRCGRRVVIDPSRSMSSSMKACR